MAQGGIKRWPQRCWLVLILGGLWGAQIICAQKTPTVDSLGLVITARDTSSVTAGTAAALDRDGFFNPIRQAVQFHLTYNGVVDADFVRGALKLQGQLPQNKGSDPSATWLFFGGTALRRPSDEGWLVLPVDGLGTIPVLNDGGLIQFSPKSGGTLFQVYPDSNIAPDKAQPALNMRVTTITADGDSLWVAGVFPGTGNNAPRGFLALRDEAGKWDSLGNPIFARGEDTIHLSEALVTSIAASNQDVWFGTVESGLLRFNKVTKAWFHYTAEKDSLAGNGIPVVAVEDETTVWVGVKDNEQVKGLARVRLLEGGLIKVENFGGLPLSRVPFPSTEIKAKSDSLDPLPDFVQVLLIDTLRVRAVVNGTIPLGIDSNAVIFPSFPSTLRVPNPVNSKADIIPVRFPSNPKARIVQSNTPGDTGSTRRVRFPEKKQQVRVREGDSLVAVYFPPDSIYISTGDTIPDSIDIALPDMVHFGTKPYAGIFLEPRGTLRLPGNTIQFPQKVKIGADSAEIFAENGRIKIRLRSLRDTTLEASSGVRIANPIRPPQDPTDFVVAALPDTVQATLSGTTVLVKLDSLEISEIQVDEKPLIWRDSLRYQRVVGGDTLKDSLFVPFPAVLRIPNPGEVGAPDFEVAPFQPPEDNIIAAIAIDPDTKDKWIGTGGSGLARLQVHADAGPDSASWNILPSEGSLRSAIIFSLQIEKRGEQKYLWAGTDAGLVRLEVNSAVDSVLSDSSLANSLQRAAVLRATADARDAWLRLFSDPLQISASATPIFSAATSATRTDANSLRTGAQSKLDTITNHLVVFSPNNSPLPDKMVRDLAIAGEDKWLATAKGLALLRDDKAGSVHHWQLFTAQHYGGRRDSLRAVEAQGDTVVWLGRLPIWYSRISWSSAPTPMPLALEKIGATAYFAGVDTGQVLQGTFNFDREPPTIRGLGPAISSRGDSTRIDSLVFPGVSEFFASVEDGEFGQEGIDSVKVFIDPSNIGPSNIGSPDLPPPAPTSLVSSSRFHGTGGTSQRVYTDTLQGLRLRRHNFSFTAPVNLTPGRHNLVLEAVDRAGNTERKAIAFSVQDSGVVEASPVFLNYPNPFGKAGQPTLFYYALNKESEKVSLRVFDLSGVLVNILIRDEPRERGTHQEIWDGRDFFGQPLANGVYLCELEVGSEKRYTKAAIFR